MSLRCLIRLACQLHCMRAVNSSSSCPRTQLRWQHARACRAASCTPKPPATQPPPGRQPTTKYTTPHGMARPNKCSHPCAPSLSPPHRPPSNPASLPVTQRQVPPSSSHQLLLLLLLPPPPAGPQGYRTVRRHAPLRQRPCISLPQRGCCASSAPLPAAASCRSLHASIIQRPVQPPRACPSRARRFSGSWAAWSPCRWQWCAPRRAA